MKKLFLFLGIILPSLMLQAQKDFDTENIMILPDSELIIAGSTNVNKFNCVFDISLISGWKKIRISREERFLRFHELYLPLRTDGFDCGNKRMNSDFQDLLMCDKYPEIRIKINKIELFPGEYNKAYVSVELAGKSKDYELPVLVSKEHFIGKFKINIRHFGLEPPKKALGLVEVDEMIEVQFNLNLDHQ
ncbi:YceI family protein [Gramella sp. GC03-9]|uniref:YceI family protein n=1 Tax=Christiangramia oceanisediminis TaxID=2920386 RepID=A0A9X2KVQ7_9FLAO|nr:YceI family protein [Gramella oceanisediminis]MCP9198703.1 YceI family protein [Gramella oceanisediminis]